MSSPNPVRKAFRAFLRGIASLIPDAVTDKVDSVVDFAYVRILGLPFIVLGYRQTGKTTLLQWLRKQDLSYLESFEPDPTAAGGEAVPGFVTRVEGEGFRLRPKRDVGGEYAMWETDWVELLREAKPRGIIFMVDHTNPYQHKDALNFVFQMIDEEVVATKRLKTFLLLVNKSDLWEEGTTQDEVLDNFRNEIRRLKSQSERVGYDYFVASSSLKSGEGIMDAMAEFFDRIRPKSGSRETAEAA